MRGGRALWLLDGVRIDASSLSKTGVTPAIELDVNLGDMLFKYGLRLVPALLQDLQSAVMPVNISPPDEQPQFEASPWLYAPLLLPSYQNPITRNIAQVRGEFVSLLEPVGKTQTANTVLLASSDNTHIVSIPAIVSLSQMPDANDKNYFSHRYLPVAVLAEGSFASVFENRMMPKNIKGSFPILTASKPTRQIFVADGDIIRNETSGQASDSATLPLGYDRYMDIRFGNSDFVLNALLYLGDETNLMTLRNRTLKLRLLNKHLAAEKRSSIQIINLLVPLFMVIALGIAFQIIRKKKYGKK
jgi:ABC-2 type transport system permease protein